MRNCVEIVGPFLDSLEQPGTPPVQMLGGIGSAALLDETTVIDLDAEAATAPDDLFLPQFRDSGTLRDVDVLVLSTSAHDTETIEARAQALIGDDLEISVFGLHDDERVHAQQARPFGWLALKTFLSDRYMEHGNEDDQTAEQELSGVKALFPFAAPLDSSIMATWQLAVQNRSMPIPHPGTTVLNYLTRSISGLRPKDASKVNTMATALFAKAPELADWIVDGPGHDQFELARVLHSLREPRDNPRSLTIGGKIELTPLDLDGLIEHPAFLLRDASLTTQQRALKLARIKARALHALESNQTIVNVFQRVAEQRLGAITKNT